ncbi:tetratricopeptide repeat protein [Streptomyces sp. NPDC091376]|uniref:tetratricopeptide repeat protein n=1 Tax=Streptomyces sp. NPDC091376 TaxID=3365994 RepID=UPI0037F731F9
MENRKLLTGFGAAVAGAAGAAVWALLFQQASTAGANLAVAPRPALNAAELLQGGVLQAQNQDFDGAKTTFRRVLQADPDNMLAWYNLGVVSVQEGRLADALEAYDSALKIDPSYTPALFNTALLLRTSNAERAIALLKRTVAINPKASTAYYQLGEMLTRRGRHGQARDAFRRAVAVDPSLQSQVPKRFKDSTSPSPSTSAGK